MNLFAIAGLSVGVSCTVLSAISFLFGKTKLHRLLMFFNLAVAVWGFGLFLVGIADAESNAISAWKFAHLGGFFVGPLFYHMVSVLCEVRRKKLIYFAYLQAAFFTFINFCTNLLFTRIRYAFGMYYLGINPIYFWGFIFYIFFVVLSFYELLRSFKKTKGRKRTQTLYIIFGFMLGFTGATSSFLPMFRIDIIYPFGNFGITLYAFILTYAILRHRLMNIHMVFKRTMVYSLSASLLTGIFIILVIFMTKFLSEFIGITSFTITVIAAITIAFLFNPIKSRIQLLADKVFYKTTYDYYAVVQKTSRELSSTIDLRYIYRFIIDTIFEIFKLRCVYLLSTRSEYFKPVYFKLPKDKFSEENKIYEQKIASGSELVKFLRESGDVLVKEELPNRIAQDKVDIIEEELEPFWGEAAVPISIDDELSFLLVLGEKLSGDFFSDQDIKVLDTIAHQAAISLKNAKLYDELDVRVKQRTVELSEANMLLKREIVERKRAEKQLAHKAFHDSLTNLPNRTSLMERLRIAFERKKRYQDYSFAVFLLDVDRFKVINDSLGHLIGDQFLIMLSHRLKKVIRAIDVVARFGGDEFVMLIEGTDKEDYVNYVADRIHNELRQPFKLDGRDIFTTVSIGITTSKTSSYKTAEDFLRDADIALYNAKSRGRACHVIFDPTLHTEAVTVLEIESGLRKAVEYNEFRLYYQPIISMEDNRITGFEALLRWQHPIRGLLAPEEFIFVAEETNLIIPIGRWVLKEACRQMYLWQQQFPEYRHLAISVNISSREFSQSNFIELIGRTLQETGLEGSCLRLELTERIIIEDPEFTSSVLHRLRGLNVQFYIDDFGTGSSALSYLRNLPVSALKIDRSFIKALAVDKKNAEIIETVISLANKLNLGVVAEGIETEEQLELFKKMRGGYAQGYLFRRPIDSKGVEALLANK